MRFKVERRVPLWIWLGAFWLPFPMVMGWVIPRMPSSGGFCAVASTAIWQWFFPKQFPRWLGGLYFKYHCGLPHVEKPSSTLWWEVLPGFWTMGKMEQAALKKFQELYPFAKEARTPWFKKVLFMWIQIYTKDTSGVASFLFLQRFLT